MLAAAILIYQFSKFAIAKTCSKETMSPFQIWIRRNTCFKFI